MTDQLLPQQLGQFSVTIKIELYTYMNFLLLFNIV